MTGTEEEKGGGGGGGSMADAQGVPRRRGHARVSCVAKSARAWSIVWLISPVCTYVMPDAANESSAAPMVAMLQCGVARCRAASVAGFVEVQRFPLCHCANLSAKLSNSFPAASAGARF